LNSCPAYSINIKNLLFKDYLTTKPTTISTAKLTTRSNEIVRYVTSLESATNSSQFVSNSFSEKSFTKADSNQYLIIWIKALVLANTIVAFVLILATVWKFSIFIKTKISKRRKSTNKKKRRNIVNNPHSEAFFEDF